MTTKIRNLLIVVPIVGILCLAGGYFGYKGYRSARRAHLIKQARLYLAKDDDRKALLCLQGALRYNSKDVQASRLMAELLERSGSPAAFIWRNRVVELDPRSVDDRLALAKTALALHDYASATNALEGVDAAGRKTAAYQNIAGTLAAGAGQPAQAAAHFLEAIRLEPQNAVPQMNLAVVRLVSTNAATLAEARATLRRISNNPTNASLRCQALRQLAADALRHKKDASALAFSSQLLLETNSAFADRLLRLNVLQQTRNPEFESTLAEFQREAGSDPAKIAALATWQMAKTSPAEALAWLQSLPVTARTNVAVMMLTADCYAARQDWRGLQAAIERQNWGEMDFTRHAMKARALREQGLSDAAKAAWEQALKAAGNQEGSKIMLLRLAAKWGWQGETEDLLWTIVNNYPSNKGAVQALSQLLFTEGRTRPLLTLFSQQVKRSPSDLGAKNNLAMVALLLGDKGVNPNELAREVYQAAPTNAAYASTYAFSLHLQKKDAEALKIMQQLKPKDLENPSVAGYYGLILKAVGDQQKAKVYLRWAARAQLLPEERSLFGLAQTPGQ